MLEQAIALGLLENKLKRAAEIGKDAASLGVDVAGDVGEKSVKAGSHLYRHRGKYGFAGLGAGATLATQKGIKAAKEALKIKSKTD